MALASYGKYSKKIQSKLNKFLKYDKKTGDFSLNPVLRFGGRGILILDFLRNL